MKGLLFSGLLALVSATFAAVANPHEELIALSEAGNGLIRLNQQTFDLLTSSKRTWSASIQLTALDARRKCSPCV